eukprot:2803420-Amphidinium_carterae.1
MNEDAITAIRGSGRVTSQAPEDTYEACLCASVVAPEMCLALRVARMLWTKALSTYGTDLTQMVPLHVQSTEPFRNAPMHMINGMLHCQAREGKLDPVIGRDEEIRRVIQVMSTCAALLELAEPWIHSFVYVCVYVCVCVRACACACVCVCARHLSC